MSIAALRTDRIGLPHDQLTDAVGLCRARINAITDVELIWEPHPRGNG